MKNLRRRKNTVSLASGALLATLATSAHAVPMQYTGEFTALNGSGVTGSATLTLDDTLLRVQINASGLEPGMTHPQHIHGRVDDSGNPLDSTTPTSAVDSDGDGFIELLEGAVTYGPVLVALTPFPTAPTGTIAYDQTFDLTDSAVFEAGFDIDSLLPLGLREIVLHGMTLEAGQGSNGGEADGTAGYKATLPVASAELSEVRFGVPEPGVLALLLAGLVPLAYRLKKRS